MSLREGDGYSSFTLIRQCVKGGLEDVAFVEVGSVVAGYV
jgi:hypothetical protein